MPGRFRQPASRASRPAPAAAGDRSSAAIADRLHSAAIHLLRSLREADRRLGLSAPRLSALSVVVFRGPLSMSDLARAEQVRKPTITRLVGELERAGLVTRNRSEKDRRVQTVEATRKGRAVLAAGRRERVTRLAAAVDRLSDGERALLDRAARLIEETVRPPSREPSVTPASER